MTIEEKKKRTLELMKDFESEYLQKKIDLDSIRELLEKCGQALHNAECAGGEVRIALSVGDCGPVIVSDLVLSFLKAVINEQVPSFESRLLLTEKTFIAELQKIRGAE